MKTYEVTQPFKGSPDGHTVIEFKKGEEVEHAQLGDDLADVALGEKWIKAVKQSKKEKAAEEAAAKAEAERLAAEEAAAQRDASIKTLQGEIANLEEQHTKAADAGHDCTEIAAQIAAKQAELAAL